LNELGRGISADKEAIIKAGKMNAAIEQVFLDAENILGRAADQ